MSRGIGLSVLSLALFLWFYEQSDALALALAWAVWAANFAYSVAIQEWRIFGVRNRPFYRLSGRFSPPMYDSARLGA